MACNNTHPRDLVVQEVAMEKEAAQALIRAVTLDEYAIHKDGFVKYHIRTTLGKENRTLRVWRRYSQFEALHKQLPEVRGLSKPRLPPKRIFANNSLNHIQHRMQRLERYLITLLQCDAFAMCRQFLEFMGAQDILRDGMVLDDMAKYQYVPNRLAERHMEQRTTAAPSYWPSNLKSFLQDHLSHRITELDVSRCSEINADAGRAIGEALRRNNTLKVLKLLICPLGDRGVIALAEGLMHNSSVEYVGLMRSDMGDNAGKAIGRMLQVNNTIKSMFLGWTSMTNEGWVAIAEGLAHNSGVRELVVQCQSFGDEAGIAMGKSLSTNTTLLSIHVSCGCISEQGGTAIAHGLEHNNTVTSISLTDCKCIGNDTAKVFGTILKSNTTLIHISLKSTSIGEGGGQALAEGLAQNSTITELDLSETRISGNLERSILSMCSNLSGRSLLNRVVIPSCWPANLKNFLQDNGSHGITELHVSHCSEINADAGRAIGEALRKNNTLKVLKVFMCPIGDEGAIALAEGLMRNTSVEYVGLMRSDIGDNAGKAIGRTLQVNNTIKNIFLGWTSMTNEGWVAVVEGLAHNTGVREIVVQCQSFGDQAATAMGESLRTNTALLSVHVSGGCISEQGGTAIAQGLGFNRTVTSISLTDCKSIGSETAKAFGTLLKRNTTLKKISLKSTSIEEEGGEALAEGLAQNSTITEIDLRETRVSGNLERSILSMCSNLSGRALLNR